MTPGRIKWLARGLLLAALLGGGGWLVWLQPAQRISTDLLDLIPAGERDPQLALVRSLAGEQQARVALFALDLPAAERRAAAAAAFCDCLQKSEAYAEVVPLQDPFVRDQLGREIFRQRFALLLPAWLAAQRVRYGAEAVGGAERPTWPAWLAEQTARRLESFLGRPEAVAFQGLVPHDPWLLVPELAMQMQGFDVAPEGAGGPVLVWALAKGSPFQEESQQRQLQAAAAAEAALRAIEPEGAVRWTSIARFASASRQRIEEELSGLNLLSLGAVILLAAGSLRQVFKALHLVPVVLGGLLGAWVVTLAAFPHVHVLVFVVGALLGGVAVDYGFYLYLQPAAFGGESYPGKARRLLKPLLASALTTVLGFLLLLWSDLPLVRQLGVFVSAGLLAALGTALLWFAQVERPFMETRGFIRWRWQPGSAARRWGRWAGALLAAVLLAGLGALRWHDDIRQLEIPAVALQEEARAVRVLFGDTPDGAAYLTRGASAAEAREAWGRFARWHEANYPGVPLLSLGRVVPAAEDWKTLPEERAALRDFAVELDRALDRRGFATGEFAPFRSEWADWLAHPIPEYEAMVREFSAAVGGPLGLMLTVSPQSGWYVSVARHPPGAEPPAELATVGLSQLENLNRLFGRYRRSALGLSALGLGLIGLSVVVLYGPWRGLRIFALPAGACLLAFGVLGWIGQALNFFHLLGAFLGVCLCHNYAIFSAENAARGEPPPPSIRLSALTTAASFGVLGFSAIPVVSALGVTVALVVLIALVGVELEPTAGIRPDGGAGA